MKIAVLALTKGAGKLAEEITAKLDGAHFLPKNNGITTTLALNWPRFDGFICIMATGIVVRAIAPLLRDKKEDPAVVVLDEKGNHIISLLSGHLGGANQLARRVAELTGGTAIITTASDTLELVALDLWAKRQDLTVADWHSLTRVSGLLVNRGSLNIYCETEVESLPPGLVRTANHDDADLLITNKEIRIKKKGATVLYPRNLIVGIGCNRGTPVTEFEEALQEILLELGLSRHAIRNLASIDVKNDEVGLLEFSSNSAWPISFFRREQINTIRENITVSEAALKAVGAVGVAEPTALLSAKTNILLSRKRKWQNITMAIAEAPFTLSAQVQDHLNT